ncbi:MAG: Na+/H+ antiporter NhaC family protein [Candidatus Marinimicrobia bacterium]|nr:Na+/H+ antiporter NhaC family protein [Candidatus Neomarinimicrobiota bacterium]
MTQKYYTILPLLFIGLPLFGSSDGQIEFGVLTLLPPLVAITLAFLTKNVLISLFLGVFSGSFILAWADVGPWKAILFAFIHFTETAQSVIANPWNAGIILQTLTIGGLIGLIAYMGGSRAIAEALSKKAKSPGSAQLYTWLMGLFIFFDDYANALTVGPIMRPVTDRLKVSREKLAFIIDSTAAPIAGIALISTWVGYELGLIQDSYNALGIPGNAYAIFVSTIPYRFYNFFILFFIVVSAWLVKDFGPMLKAEQRARQRDVVLEDAKPDFTGSDEAINPPKGIKYEISNALIPIMTLIIGAFAGLWFNGYLNIVSGDNPVLTALVRETPFNGIAVRECFSASSAAIVLFQSSLLASIVSIIMGLRKKIFTIKKALEVWTKGVKSLLFTILILTLAWSLSSVIKEMNTAAFLVAILGDNLPAFMLPAVIFILGATISFATGTSYGTMGILMPLAIPLAYAMNPDAAFMSMTIGSVLTGAIFGDHCSPISDTTILSSMGASCDHIDHTRTQIFYAIPVAVIAIIFGYLPVGLGLPVSMAIILGLGAVFALLYFVGRKAD